MMLCSPLRDRVQAWLRDYDSLQFLAVILIYVQIVCALIGSLGALYNGVLLINLAIALFALVAIESSSQSLGRTYAVLLFCAILVDVAWFILFSNEIWNISSEKYGAYFIFSLKLALAMQIIGCSVRLSSSLLWIQIYRLGVSSVGTIASQEVDFDLRNSFLNPATPAVVRQCSGSDEAIGGAIYDPAYYASLFEDGQEIRYTGEGQNRGIAGNWSPSGAGVSHQKVSLGRSFKAIDEESAVSKPQTVLCLGGVGGVYVLPTLIATNLKVKSRIVFYFVRSIIRPMVFLFEKQNVNSIQEI